MAVPSLPADKSAGDDFDETDANAIYDLLEWFRDTRPLFKGEATGGNVATATNVEMGHGTVASTFTNAATTNVGSWAVSSDINTGGTHYNVEVPEAGHYVGCWQVLWAGNATGYRYMQPMLDSAGINGSRNRIDAGDGTTDLNQQAWFEVDAAADQELSVDLLQNSGSTLSTTVWLVAWWIQST